MKRLLITGATGLLGANAVEHFLNGNFIVRIMVRDTQKAAKYFNSSVEIFKGSLEIEQDVNEAVKNCDWVLHAAGKVHTTDATIDEYMQANYVGTQNIVRACLRHQVKKMVYIGTASIVGPGNEQEPATELDDYNLVFLQSGYLHSKYLAHQFVLEQVVKKQLNAVIISPTFMLGKKDFQPSSGAIISRALHKRILFCPPGRKHFVHVQDVVQAIDKALQQSSAGAHYLLTGKGMSYKQFYQKLKQISAMKYQIVELPKWLLLVLGRMGSVLRACKVKGISLTYDVAYLLCLQAHYSNQLSQRELQINYHSIENAMKDSYVWFQGNNV